MLRRLRTAAARSSRSSVGEGARGDQLVGVGRGGREPADRERGPVDRERRDHHVDARAVGEPGVGHRAELVDPPAERRQDALDRVAQGAPRSRTGPRSARSGPRARRRPSSGPLTITSSTAGIGKQLLERPEADRVAQDQLADLARAGPPRAPPRGRRPARPPRPRARRPSRPATASARRRSASRRAKLGGERLGVAVDDRPRQCGIRRTCRAKFSAWIRRIASERVRASVASHDRRAGSRQVGAPAVGRLGQGQELDRAGRAGAFARCPRPVRARW